MKTTPLLFALPLLTSLALAQAEKLPEPPVPVMQQSRASTALLTTPETQRLFEPARTSLIAPETARALVEKFRAAYPGARLVLYVNRELVDRGAGPALKDRTVNYEKTVTDGKTTSLKETGTRTYAAAPAPAKPALADRQTVRDIERLFGRAFRAGGAQLADQAAATALLADKTGDLAARDRAALGQIADIAVEILLTTRSLAVPEVSGDRSYAVPDLQATAIRLKDSAIIGQAAAADVLGKGGQAGAIARQFTSADITEATALALIEDMLTK